jgi:hypothetical protein
MAYYQWLERAPEGAIAPELATLPGAESRIGKNGQIVAGARPAGVAAKRGP